MSIPVHIIYIRITEIMQNINRLGEFILVWACKNDLNSHGQTKTLLWIK